MANNPPSAQTVFLATYAQVVNDHRETTVAQMIRKHPDMVESVVELPPDDVAWLPGAASQPGGKRNAVSPEKMGLVGNPSMVDVGVGPLAPPRIRSEMPHHILVNQPLEVDAGISVCPNNYVSTDSFASRHISIGIGNAPVAGVVRRTFRGLELCAFDDPLDDRRTRAMRRPEDREKGSNHRISRPGLRRGLN